MMISAQMMQSYEMTIFVAAVVLRLLSYQKCVPYAAHP